MKITLNAWEVAEYLLSDTYAKWSHAGAHALASFLEEEEAGVDEELDVCAIRCSYSQYDSLEDWAQEYTGKSALFEALEALGLDNDTTDEDYVTEQLRAYVFDRAVLIEFTDGIILGEL